MMKYFLSEVGRDEQKNAIQKPRSDSEKTMSKLGFTPVYTSYQQSDPITKHLKRYQELMAFSKKLQPGDIFLVQHPALRNTIFLKKFLLSIKETGVKTVALVHDLNYIRRQKESNYFQKAQLYLKDVRTLAAYDKVIVHNDAMKFELQKWGIPATRLVPLEMFDYLTEDGLVDREDEGIIIAGNLSRGKAGYCYQLPKAPYFNLYGSFFEASQSKNGENVSYKGTYEPNNISVMKGKYGLVWDGPSSTTCSGDYGHYLKYNTPFKSATYLAAGLPVIVWEKSALKQFVSENKCGFAVKSLFDIEKALKTISDEQYNEMKNNSLQIGEKIRNGEFLKSALEKCF